MARTITSANCGITLSILPIYPSVTLQNFAADDITDMQPIQMTETMMGADGKLAGGYTPQPIDQTIAFMADSLSIDVFERWGGYNIVNRETFPANGVLTIPSLGKRYVLTKGFLKTYAPISNLKKTSQPRSFTITWESVVPTAF